MNENLMVLVITCISSSALFTFITFLITRKDNRSNKEDEILKRLDKIEKIQREQQLSELRTELSIHLLHHKKDKITIMRIAEKYFKDLNGDFYMTSKFCEWLKKMGMPRPEWFDPTK